MNSARLMPLTPSPGTDGARDAGMAGVAAMLAASLPPGCQVQVQWDDPQLGAGASSSGAEPSLPAPHVVEARWSGPGQALLSLSASSADPWPEGLGEHWLPSARLLVEMVLRLAQAQRQIESLRHSERLQQALYTIADLAGGSLDMQEMLRRIHAIVGELMYAANFYIVLYDAGRQAMRFLYFVDQRDTFVPDPDEDMDVGEAETEARSSLTMALLRGGEPMRGPSGELRARHGVPWVETNGPDSADWLGVPMLRDGQVVGAIVVQSYERPDVYSDEDRVLLAYVAQHTLTALDRRQARAELERRVAERTRELSETNRELQAEVAERQRSQQLQRALFRIAELSSTSQTLEEFYGEIHQVVADLLYARNFYVAMLSDDGGMLEFPYSVDERDTLREPRKVSKGLTEYVLASGKALLADRARIAALESAGKVRSIGTRANCWLGVPLLHDDKVVGVLALQSYSADIAFSGRDQELLTFIAFHIGSGLARKQAQERLVQAHAELERRVSERTRELAEANAELMEQIGERLRTERKLAHQASHDTLTGLPNRAQLLERLGSAIAQARHVPSACFAVLFMDLDRFKLVNDSMGHAVGDELLVEVGRRIVGTVRGSDVVSRLGGDEFAILAEGLDGPEMAEELGRRVLAALGAPLWIAGREVFPTASIGIAIWHPRYTSGEDMLRDADAAMYRAKGEGRDRSMMFDEAMREAATRVLDLESDLRRAINSDAFVPYYQPIVHIEDGMVVGQEALLRWQHERLGLLSPGDFLDVGEESGLIEQVDWLLYARVIADMAKRPHDRRYVAINVSPRHFHSPDFSERLLGLLEAAGVSPWRLRIEITEVALLDDAPRVSQILSDLRDQGVRAQLDDFGTGFSALSYLHRFPIASLKIDRGFVAGLDSEERHESLAVVRGIIALANSLDLEIIAEGIETARQRDDLTDMGCTYGQGFLFGKPVANPE